MEDFARLIDALEFIHFFKVMIMACDVNPKIPELYAVNAAFNNTTKQISSNPFSARGAADLCRMAMAVAGGKEAFKQRPMIIINMLAVSPLQWSRENLGAILALTRMGCPMIIGSEPQGGTTGPSPLAGQVMLNVAETLAGITLVQLLKPNTPIMWGNVGSISDMRSGLFASGAVELGLLNAAMNQMAKFYKVPTYSTGGMSDSKGSDAQAGVEKSLQALTVALAGGNYIHDAAGMMESCLLISYEQYVIDNEMLGMIARILEGIRVTPETLSFDAIKQVGPRKNFMGLRHTLNHIKSEHYLPGFLIGPPTRPGKPGAQRTSGRWPGKRQERSWQPTSRSLCPKRFRKSSKRLSGKPKRAMENNRHRGMKDTKAEGSRQEAEWICGRFGFERTRDMDNGHVIL